jgi:large repetitive protein
MSRFNLSSWFNFSADRKHRKTKTSGTSARAQRPAGRFLRVEHLEDRQMLSVSIGTVVPAGVSTHAAAVAAANPAPTISNVVTSSALHKITWNATDASGVASSGLTIAGVPVADATGPWTAASGLNYSWSYNALSAGTYAYVITATDVTGATSQYAGTLTVGSGAGPTTSKIVVSTAQGVISWNSAAASGTTSCSLTLDGAGVTNVYGPWAATTGATYEGSIGTVAEGCHTYVISATDGAGQTSHYTGWFVTGTSTPTINNVMLAANQGTITWNTAAVGGIKSATLSVDGIASTVAGPWDAASGYNYQGTFGALASGNHSYTITITGNSGLTTKSTGVFAVSGPTISKVAVATAAGSMTWNVTGSNGVASTALTVDGVGVSLSGAYAALSGSNYSAALGSLTTGSHTYVITASDNSGRWSQFSGIFQVTNPAPTISKVAVSVAKGLITCNAYDADGVATVSVTVDGVARKILGPYKAASGYNYQGVFGVLAAGKHTYVIRAADTTGSCSQSSGTFVV